MKSKISWTDITLNLQGGCSKISPGCDNCYAIRTSRRLAGIYKGTGINALKKYVGTTRMPLNWTGKINADKADIIESFNRLPKTVSKKVFINSMSDLFHENVPKSFVLNVMDEMSVYNQHIFQFLTKRPENAYKFFSGYLNHDEIYKNVWLGVTTENQEMADKRIPILLKTPAAVRFLSCEPLLNDIKLTRIECNDNSNYCTINPLTGIHSDMGRRCPDVPKLNWVIIGCESGPNRRLCKLEWILSLYNQAQKAGIAVFIKQIDYQGKVIKDESLIKQILGLSQDVNIREFPR